MDPGLAAFRQRVFDDPVLGAELRAEVDPRRLAVLVVARAAAAGLTVTPEAVEAELHAARRRWLERWV
jgi:hypothetical protein